MAVTSTKHRGLSAFTIEDSYKDDLTFKRDGQRVYVSSEARDEVDFSFTLEDATALRDHLTQLLEG